MTQQPSIISRTKTAISLGLVIVIVSFLVTTVVFAMSVKSKVDRNSEHTALLTEEVSELNDRDSALRSDFDTQSAVINEKLDNEAGDIAEIKDSLDEIEKEIREINKKLP